MRKISALRPNAVLEQAWRPGRRRTAASAQSPRAAFITYSMAPSGVWTTFASAPGCGVSAEHAPAAPSDAAISVRQQCPDRALALPEVVHHRPDAVVQPRPGAPNPAARRRTTPACEKASARCWRSWKSWVRVCSRSRVARLTCRLRLGLEVGEQRRVGRGGEHGRHPNEQPNEREQQLNRQRKRSAHVCTRTQLGTDQLCHCRASPAVAFYRMILRAGGIRLTELVRRRGTFTLPEIGCGPGSRPLTRRPAQTRQQVFEIRRQRRLERHRPAVRGMLSSAAGSACNACRPNAMVRRLSGP